MTPTNQDLISFLQDIYENGGECKLNLNKYTTETVHCAQESGLIEFNEEVKGLRTVLLTVKGTSVLTELIGRVA